MDDCPRGFKFCKTQQKCVPIHSGVEDKLDLKYQRYFFKGDDPMNKIPINKLHEAEELVDLAFDESFEIFGKVIKAEKKLEKLLNILTQECASCGCQDGEMLDNEAMEEPDTVDDYEDDEPNDIAHEPNQNATALYASVIKQMSEYNNLSEDKKAEYKAYFNGMLKKYGVKNPSQLPDDKKKDFFNAVDKGWKAKKETD
jgi:hypothetical protein